MPLDTEHVTKGHVLELATRQSKNAQRVTRHIRSHGWSHYWAGGGRCEADDEYRRREAARALEHARLVERDARAIRSWVEAWAKQEGVNIKEREA